MPMIQDAAVRQSIVEQWATILRLCDPSHRQVQIPGGSFFNELRPGESYNVPLLLAYGALDQVLGQLIAEGRFISKARMLGARMEASRDVLPWRDYSLVDEGKNRRNDLAHKGKLLSEADCLRYIKAIGAELKAWGVV